MMTMIRHHMPSIARVMPSALYCANEINHNDSFVLYSQSHFFWPRLIWPNILRMWHQRVDHADRLKMQLTECRATASQRVITVVWGDKQRVCVVQDGKLLINMILLIQQKSTMKRNGTHLQRSNACQTSKPAAMRPVHHRHREETGSNFV